MEEITYEVTIPHTSIHVRYDRKGWKTRCPMSANGTMCSDGSEVVGYRYSSEPAANLRFKFYGERITYLLLVQH
jgi:hypothetical protein